MQNQKQGIAIAGSLISDVFYQIDTYPEQGLLVNVRDTAHYVGGSGNLILDLAKLDKDLPVKVYAVVGADDNGKHLISTLSKYDNIDRSGITVDGESSVTIVMNASDTKQRTFFFIPGASDVFDENCVDWENISAKIFHLEYLLLMKKIDAFNEEYGTNGAKMLCKAKEKGMLTSIDIVSEQSDRAQKIIKSALKYTDICCINEFEAQSVTEINLLDRNGEFLLEEVKRAMFKLRDFGVSKWIVIHSPKISFGYDVEKNEFVSLKSFELPQAFIKGTTGAGDAYCCGILYSAYCNQTITQAMKLARATATCSLSENNGSDGLRPIQDVLAFVKQFKEL